LPKLSRKKSKENDLKKNKKITPAIHSILGAFFQVKAFQASFLPKFPLTCLKKNLKTWPQKKRNVCTSSSGAFFAKSKHIKQSCGGFHTFYQDFKGFYPDFNQIKTFRGALAPHAPPPPTPLALNVLLKTFTQLVWMPEKAVLPQTHLIRFARNVKIQRSLHPWRRFSLKFGILICDRKSNTCL